jgi:hypothetical protein
MRSHTKGSKTHKKKQNTVPTLPRLGKDLGPVVGLDKVLPGVDGLACGEELEAGRDVFSSKVWGEGERKKGRQRIRKGSGWRARTRRRGKGERLTSKVAEP